MSDFGIIIRLSFGMSDHCWSIMEGTTVMTNLRCGPDFPITPLPDLPGRCQNQEEPKNQKSKEQPYRGESVRDVEDGTHQR